MPRRVGTVLGRVLPDRLNLQTHRGNGGFAALGDQRLGIDRFDGGVGHGRIRSGDGDQKGEGGERVNSYSVHDRLSYASYAAVRLATAMCRSMSSSGRRCARPIARSRPEIGRATLGRQEPREALDRVVWRNGDLRAKRGLVERIVEHIVGSDQLAERIDRVETARHDINDDGARRSSSTWD